MPSGTRPEIGADGKPTGRLEQLWMVLKNDGKVNLTPELKQAYGLGDVANGQPVSLAALMKSATTQQLNNNVGMIIQRLGQQQDEAFGGSSHADVTLKTLQGMNKSFTNPNNIAKLQAIAGMNPGEAVATLQKNGDGNLAATLVSAFGINTDKWTEKTAADKKAEVDKAARELKQQEESDKMNTPEGRLDIQKKQLEVKKLQSDRDGGSWLSRSTRGSGSDSSGISKRPAAHR